MISSRGWAAQVNITSRKNLAHRKDLDTIVDILVGTKEEMCHDTHSVISREEGTASGIKLCGPGNDWVVNTGLEKTTFEVSPAVETDAWSWATRLCGHSCQHVFLYAPSSPCVGSLCLFAGHSEDCSLSNHQLLPSGILFPVLHYLVLLCPLSSSLWTVISLVIVIH